MSIDRPKSGMRPVHPGEILREELEVLGLSASALAEKLDVAVSRITEILRERRGVTADTALRLARYFGTTPQVWVNLQKRIRAAHGRNPRQSADLCLREASAGN